MTRIYRALIWIACATLILGAMNAVNAFTGAGQRVAANAGWINVLQVILFLGAVTAISIPAVIGLGLVAAWADKRTGWLVALALVTAATIAWRPLEPMYMISASPDPNSSHAVWLYQSFALSLFVTPLVPVALTLIFAIRELRQPR